MGQQGHGRLAPVIFPPVVQYAFGQSSVRNEDMVLVKAHNLWPSEKEDGPAAGDLTGLSPGLRSVHASSIRRWSGDSALRDEPNSADASFGLYCLFDGRNGPLCAQWVAVHLVEALQPLLPSGHPPHESHRSAYKEWREEIQQALCVVLTMLHRSFAGAGVLGGCSATIILQWDWLLTVANLGNSKAILDTGREIIPLTTDDFATRGLGDLNLPGASMMISLPLITQVRVPSTGGRIILASESVWQSCEKISRPSSAVRSWSTLSAPQRILDSSTRFRTAKDDESVVVVDLLPPNRDSFTDVARVTPAWKKFFGGSKASRKPPVEVPVAHVMMRIDLAVLAGLVPGALVDPPLWFSQDLNEALLEAMEQAVIIWESVHKQVMMGETPINPTLDAPMTPPQSKWGASPIGSGGGGQRSGGRQSFDAAAAPFLEARRRSMDQRSSVRNSFSAWNANGNGLPGVARSSFDSAAPYLRNHGMREMLRASIELQTKTLGPMPAAPTYSSPSYSSPPPASPQPMKPRAAMPLVATQSAAARLLLEPTQELPESPMRAAVTRSVSAPRPLDPISSSSPPTVPSPAPKGFSPSPKAPSPTYGGPPPATPFASTFQAVAPTSPVLTPVGTVPKLALPGAAAAEKLAADEQPPPSSGSASSIHGTPISKIVAAADLEAVDPVSKAAGDVADVNAVAMVSPAANPFAKAQPHTVFSSPKNSSRSMRRSLSL